MRVMVAMVLIAGCTDTPSRDPNELGMCQAEWRAGVTTCAIGCPRPANPQLTGECRGVSEPGGVCTQNSVVEFDGVRGCCSLNTVEGTMAITFEACE